MDPLRDALVEFLELPLANKEANPFIITTMPHGRLSVHFFQINPITSTADIIRTSCPALLEILLRPVQYFSMDYSGPLVNLQPDLPPLSVGAPYPVAPQTLQKPSYVANGLPFYQNHITLPNTIHHPPRDSHEVSVPASSVASPPGLLHFCQGPVDPCYFTAIKYSSYHVPSVPTLYHGRIGDSLLSEHL
ncbi:hypothetical protein L596_003268 [Steinernema carpocapsae]|uniref:Uncharacterized protein n=1 Tax=Steinernema carpocapsae TaxID=34508 RepID=A0A4V6I7Z1_STECR|nr:hypothetical protein L596_003268 [Steinernema carpocapsae]